MAAPEYRHRADCSDQCLRSGSVLVSQPRQPEALVRGEPSFARKRPRVIAQLKTAGKAARLISRIYDIKQIFRRPCVVFFRGALLIAMTGDAYQIAGIQCRSCGRRALLPLYHGLGEINGSQSPSAGQRCGNCGSTTFAWRRFVTLAEGDVWLAESVGGV